MILILILIVLLFAEVFYVPRVDYTRDNKVILWYGKKIRKYKVLFNIRE
jgi:hypothetical protein